MEEIETAKKENKTKLLEKLRTKEQNLQTRKQTIEEITPITRRLVHGDMIQKCWARLFPLQHLEEKERNMKLTLQDLEAVSEKTEIEEQITQMQNASKGWFEEETVFEEVRLPEVHYCHDISCSKISPTLSITNSFSSSFLDVQVRSK